MHYIITALGCKVNQYEAQAIETLLHPHGFTAAGEGDPVDLIVVNTCAVTAEGGRKSRQMIRKLREEHPQALCAVCGCWSQLSPEDAAAIGADVVHGSGSKQAFVDDILRAFREHTPVTCVDNPFRRFDFEPLPAGAAYGRTRAMLKIQDGCNNFCTYCIVPFVRGRERSRRPEEVIAEVKGLINDGYKEILLLGQNVNSYGKEYDFGFAKLLSELDKIPGKYKLSFMTSHPKDCTHELIDTIADSRHISYHLHLPVQCGSDRILKEMNRHYDTAHYLELIEYAKKRIPKVALTTDIIVGFPGETYEDFLGTVELMKKVRYDSAYTFIYSKREGTKAAAMPDPISDEDKGKWFRQLLDVQNSIGEKAYERFIGDEVEVLCEGIGRTADELMTGHSRHGVIVDFNGTRDMIGKYVTVRIQKALPWAVTGELVSVND